MNCKCFEPHKDLKLFCRLATLRPYMIALIVPSIRTIGRSHYKICTPPATCVTGHFMYYMSNNELDNQQFQPLPLPCHQHFQSIHLPSCHPHPTLHRRCHHIHITHSHMMCPHHHVLVFLASYHVAPSIAILHLLLHTINALRSRPDEPSQITEGVS